MPCVLSVRLILFPRSRQERRQTTGRTTSCSSSTATVSRVNHKLMGCRSILWPLKCLKSYVYVQFTDDPGAPTRHTSLRSIFLCILSFLHYFLRAPSAHHHWGCTIHCSAVRGAASRLARTRRNEVHVATPLPSSAAQLLQPPMVLQHQIGGYTEKFGSHEPLLPLLCHRIGTHGREDKRHVLEQPPHTLSIHIHTHTCPYIQAHAPKALSLHPLLSSPSPKQYQRHLNRDFDEENTFLKAILYKVSIKIPWVMRSSLKKQFITCRFPLRCDLCWKFQSIQRFRWF